MFSQYKSQTIAKNLSSKTLTLPNNGNIKEQLKKYFIETFAAYERLFNFLKDDKAYYIRAEPLRHPLIFYYGHTAAVYINKLIQYGTIHNRVNQDFQKIFAVGVDQMDWDDVNDEHYDWPTVQETRQFREQVKHLILEVIDNIQQNKIENWLSHLWILLLGIEHERIHLETSAVIMRQVPLKFMQYVQQFPECPYKENDLKKIPQNSLVDIPAWRGKWERSKDAPQTFSWDNELGTKIFDVSAFKSSKMLVSNGEYLQFVEEGGYQTSKWWTQQGKKWLASIKPSMPRFWCKDGDTFRLRTISRLIGMPWDWPVQVNNLQARAFCKWKGSKLNTYIRLLTEDEYISMRQVIQNDQPTWQYQSVGNINMEYWMSPNPVNFFKIGQLYDIVGNVWQHTITPLYPFTGFQIHPVYEDFSTNAYDERHDVIKGGSFLSTGNEALSYTRQNFWRHIIQFSGIRYIQTQQVIEVDVHSEQINDCTVEMNLKHHYLNPKSYVIQLADKIRQRAGKWARTSKVLTVGCSVGRVPLQLAKYFQKSIGIDYTTRFFQMSTRLREKKYLKFKDIDIDLSKMDIPADQTQLFQMNPENPDSKKINQCDWIIIDGFSIKKNALKIILRKILKLGRRNTYVAILNVSGYNDMKKQEARNIMAQVSDGDVIIEQEVILDASRQDQSYLPNCNEQLEFRLNYYRITDS